MLTNKHIAIIGGDKRYISMIHALTKHNLQIDLIGYDAIDFKGKARHCQYPQTNMQELDAIILPIAGCASNGEITLNFPKDKVLLTSELLSKTKPSCTIYTGIANEHLVNLALEANRKLVTLFSRDDIAIANSIPTAEGTLEIAMAQTDYTIHNSNVLITGFGRIGMTIARLFHQVGANVTVTARKHADFARIKEMRLTPLHHNDLKHTNYIDIYIQTVPTLLLTKEIIAAMKPTAIIIDLASAPGGTDFSTAKKQKITAIHALALPGKVAPNTAGEIIADTLVSLLDEK